MISIDPPFDLHPSDPQTALKRLTSGPSARPGSTAAAATGGFSWTEGSWWHELCPKANKTRQDWEIAVLISLQSRTDKTREREREKNGTVPSKTSRSVQNGENNRWRVQRRAQDCILVAIGFTSPFLASPINEVNSSRFVIVLFRMTLLGSQWHHVTAVKQVILLSPSDWCWSITCVRYHALVFF